MSTGGLLDFADERRVAHEDFASASRENAVASKRRYGNLSGGNQQKVALARWLMTEPRMLILDEPTQGIDVGAKSRDIHADRRTGCSRLAILMISSEMPEILGMSDRIAVMQRAASRRARSQRGRRRIAYGTGARSAGVAQMRNLVCSASLPALITLALSCLPGDCRSCLLFVDKSCATLRSRMCRCC